MRSQVNLASRNPYLRGNSKSLYPYLVLEQSCKNSVRNNPIEKLRKLGLDHSSCENGARITVEKKRRESTTLEHPKEYELWNE